jgi:hypothetical protein
MERKHCFYTKNQCIINLSDGQERPDLFFIAPPPTEGNNMLTKNQVIDAICRLNPTAPIDWLSSFDLSALRRYYEHLLITLEPRGTRGWVRMSDTPAVITRRPAA